MLSSNQIRWLLVLGVFALAATVRLWGIDHALPLSTYPDEAHFVKRALSSFGFKMLIAVA